MIRFVSEWIRVHVRWCVFCVDNDRPKADFSPFILFPIFYHLSQAPQIEFFASFNYPVLPQESLGQLTTIGMGLGGT